MIVARSLSQTCVRVHYLYVPLICFCCFSRSKDAAHTHTALKIFRSFVCSFDRSFVRSTNLCRSLPNKCVLPCRTYFFVEYFMCAWCVCVYISMHVYVRHWPLAVADSRLLCANFLQVFGFTCANPYINTITDSLHISNRYK